MNIKVWIQEIKCDRFQRMDRVKMNVVYILVSFLVITFHNGCKADSLPEVIHHENDKMYSDEFKHALKEVEKYAEIEEDKFGNQKTGDSDNDFHDNILDEDENYEEKLKEDHEIYPSELHIFSKKHPDQQNDVTDSNDASRIYFQIFEDENIDDVNYPGYVDLNERIDDYKTPFEEFYDDAFGNDEDLFDGNSQNDYGNRYHAHDETDRLRNNDVIIPMFVSDDYENYVKHPHDDEDYFNYEGEQPIYDDDYHNYERKRPIFIGISDLNSPTEKEGFVFDKRSHGEDFEQSDNSKFENGPRSSAFEANDKQKHNVDKRPFVMSGAYSKNGKRPFKKPSFKQYALPLGSRFRFGKRQHWEGEEDNMENETTLSEERSFSVDHKVSQNSNDASHSRKHELKKRPFIMTSSYNSNINRPNLFKNSRKHSRIVGSGFRFGKRNGEFDQVFSEYKRPFVMSFGKRTPDMSVIPEKRYFHFRNDYHSGKMRNNADENIDKRTMYLESFGKRDAHLDNGRWPYQRVPVNDFNQLDSSEKPRHITAHGKQTKRPLKRDVSHMPQFKKQPFSRSDDVRSNMGKRPFVMGGGYTSRIGKRPFGMSGGYRSRIGKRPFGMSGGYRSRIGKRPFGMSGGYRSRIGKRPFGMSGGYRSRIGKRPFGMSGGYRSRIGKRPFGMSGGYRSRIGKRPFVMSGGYKSKLGKRPFVMSGGYRSRLGKRPFGMSGGYKSRFGKRSFEMNSGYAVSR